MNAKVSVIIPVYNVELYIEQTLNSVINQTFSDIEIIVIDNKSTDNTLSVVEKYAQNDKRFVIIKNSKNYKQGMARNLGVEKACGDYIFFLDGDDYIELDAIEKLYNKITQSDADITICSWNKFNNATGKINKKHFYSKLNDIPNEFDNKVFSWRDIKNRIFWQSNVPWDKIYKRNFLTEKNVKFPEDIFFEDNVFVYDALFKADKISILREDLIFYRYNRKNAVTNSKNETYFDYLKIFDFIKANIENIGLWDEMKFLFLDYMVITLYWWFMKINFRYKHKFFNLIKADFQKLQIAEEDKQFLTNRTLFLINRFTKLPFWFYYPFFFFLDKIFRVEKGQKNYTIVYLSKYKTDYNY